MFEVEQSYNEKIEISFPNNIVLYMKREDLLHEEVSGNKFRKLKYNVKEALVSGYTKLLTFGGAFSNHIAATAAVGKIFGIETIGIIRGEELVNGYKNNPTLLKAERDGMKLKFISRTDYRNKTSDLFLATLQNEIGEFYLVPEGGTNELALKGTEEILKPFDETFDYVCCAVGTGGTIAGIINSAKSHQEIIGFPALKGDFLYDEIKKYTTKDNWCLQLDYHFGGYAKYNDELLRFIVDFEQTTNIKLDPIYTGKLVYGIFDLIRKGQFKANSKILAIHTGGLQGWNNLIKLKNV